MNSLKIIKLGRVPYQQAYKVQKFLQNARQAKTIQDHVLITEHSPVYTLGLRKLAGESLKWPIEEIKRKLGAEVEESFRGGDVTFFGPGTLMVYGLLNIKERHLSAYEYVDKLEDIMIDCLDGLGVKGCIGRIPEKRGVWTTEAVGEEPQARRKVGAIGVGMSKWTTIHGFALNVHTDLKFFEPIIPCGLRDSETTTVVQELSRRGGHVPSDGLLHDRAVELIIKALPEHLRYDFVEVVDVQDLSVGDISLDPSNLELPFSVKSQLMGMENATALPL